MHFIFESYPLPTVSGVQRGFRAQATPNFDDLIREVARSVADPEDPARSL
eukprot:COSAG01_NODE_3028_length_6703_cov_2.824955_2_plen_50_part_00